MSPLYLAHLEPRNLVKDRIMKTSVLFVVSLLGLPGPVLRAEKFDVVVYGGTAGGVIAAVSAAREGLKVALLEPGRHLGGMVSGGLSWTDFGRKEIIGGFFAGVFSRGPECTPLEIPHQHF